VSDEVAERPVPSRRLLAGWGHASSSAADVASVQSQLELEHLIVSAGESGTKVLARGLGRSYGDAAQCAGGTVLDCTGLAGLVIDDGVARAEAGVSLDQLLRTIVPLGWFVPVTPGTAQVTIGGAIAADVHGKNHHRDGAFGGFVRRLALCTPKGRIEVGPSHDPEAFWATVGGMGLTGAVAEADLELRPIETAKMLVDTESTADLEGCMARLSASDDEYRYSVAWVDCSVRGRGLGRSVLSLGDHAKLSDLPAAERANPLEYAPGNGVAVPLTAPINLVSRAAIRAGNELWFRNGRRHHAGELHSIAAFFHPLDALREWHRVYGPRGFTQYQYVVPFGAEDVVARSLERLHAARVVPSLAVLKRFGAADPSPLGFPSPGWTLALDLPLAARDLAPVLDDLDELVAEAGGRVYLAKDGRLRPELLRAMYPGLDAWLETRERLDPAGVVASDLWRRLSGPRPTTAHA
jgi:decaprenylphospho-beta-D-ribofuranose 2-oxidase